MRVSDLANGLRHWLRASWRLLVAVAVLAGALAAEHAFFGSSGWLAATVAHRTGRRASGNGQPVRNGDSSKPFKAAQVYIRNVDKRILYMVFTNAGQFRAVSLFPGNYEISVASKGFESEVQKLVAESRETTRRLKLSLAAGPQRRCAHSNGIGATTLKPSYDEIYPPGPGRDGGGTDLHGLSRRELPALAAGDRGGRGTPASIS